MRKWKFDAAVLFISIRLARFLLQPTCCGRDDSFYADGLGSGRGTGAVVGSHCRRHRAYRRDRCLRSRTTTFETD